MKYSLVIPCYNESLNLALLLEKCQPIGLRDNCEVILVDNGSTDDTSEVLEKLLPNYPGCRSVKVVENKGYGYGIICGIDSSEGDVVGWTHADMQTDPLDFIKGLELFEKYGEDIFVKGKRFGRPIGDTVFTIGMSFFESVLLLMPLWDINAQPTMFSRRFYQSWKQAPFDFSLDLFAYYQAKKSGLSVKRFPVRFGERAYGVSHWNINWRAKWKFILRTIEFSFQLRSKVNS